MNKNIPPFYVGQKVKCIDVSNLNYPETSPKEGAEYIVGSIRIGCNCPASAWVITIGIKGIVDGAQCRACGHHEIRPTTERAFAASRFRAITDDFQAITFEKVLEEELVSMN